MKRVLLTLVTLALLLLVVVDRLSHVMVSSFATTTAPVAPPPLPTHAAAGARADAVLDSAAGATPTVDRLARLAVRRRLAAEAAATYIDSLIVSTDSVVRRWPDRGGALRVAIIEGGPRDYSPRMAGYVRAALDRWEEVGAGVRFEVVADTTSADITIRWIDRFAFDRAGQTDLTWDQLGRVRRASIALATRTSAGLPLSDGALGAVAVHELGHALGLPHSPVATDVMYPATRTATLSDRDRRTALLLYQLAPGPIRDH